MLVETFNTLYTILIYWVLQYWKQHQFKCIFRVPCLKEGSAVEFSCAVPHGATVNLTWSIYTWGKWIHKLPGGVKKTTVSFMATASNNNTDIACIADGILMDPMCF